MSKRIYIIDPGHGGINPSTGEYVTPGKRSPRWADGSILYEGVSNRKIAALVGQKLTALGISFVFTVEPNDWKDVSLATRVRRADAAAQLSKKDGILISIHSNAAADPAANGTETFTTPGKTGSDAFATILIEEYKKAFPEIKSREDRTDGDPDKEAKFTILTGDTVAMLIELCFHTNEKECRMLMDSFVQNRMANAIVEAIKRMDQL